MGVSGWARLRTSKIRLRAVSAKESAHMDQAIQAAVRGLILLATACLWSASRLSAVVVIPLCVGFWTLLYLATICQVLGQPLRGEVHKKCPSGPTTHEYTSKVP